MANNIEARRGNQILEDWTQKLESNYASYTPLEQLPTSLEALVTAQGSLEHSKSTVQAATIP